MTFKSFFEYLNAKHPDIKYTLETEKDKQLLFIDISVSSIDIDLSKVTFDKNKQTGLLINDTSFTFRYFLPV